MAGPRRAALIGCGRIGAGVGAPGTGSSRIRSHAEAWSGRRDVALVALCDASADVRDRAAERFALDRRYEHPEEMLKREEPELVSLATPAASRVETLRAVLACPSVRGVLLEKPVASSRADLAAIERIVRSSPAKVAVNHIRRFPPAYVGLAKEMRAGDLGRILDVRVLYTKGILNNGSHAIDLLASWFGPPVEARLERAAPGDDPPVDARLVFPGGIVASLRSLPAEALNVFEVDVLGTEGRVILRDQGHVLDRYGVHDARARHGFRQLAREPLSTATGLADAIRFAVDDLLAAVDDDRTPLCTLTNAREALEACFDLIDQTRTPP